MAILTTNISQEVCKFCTVLLWVILLPFVSFTQEICDNGIDDDGDGLIDILDVEDCLCADVLPGSVVGDFEVYSCCPSSFTLPGGVGGVHCLDDGWQIGSTIATTDFFHTCDYVGGNGILPLVPMPIPSGDGCIGMASQTGYNEQIGYCLPNPLIPGLTYNFGFYIGFNTIPGILSPLNVDVYLHGTDDCNNLPNNTVLDCVTSDPAWYDITNVTANGTMNNSWLLVQTTFTATSSTNAIAIGIDCGSSSAPIQYHYMDSIYISGDFLMSSPDEIDIMSEGDCINGITLEVPDQPGVTYQWYLDGVAIVGATTNPFIPDPIQNGVYQVVVDDGVLCVLSNPFELMLDLEVLPIVGVVNDITCYNDNNASIDIDPQSDNIPLIIEWSNGESTEDLMGLQGGIYTVTVIDDNGCFGTATYTITNPDSLIAQLTIQQPVYGQPGSATVVVSGGVPDYSYNWSNGNMTNSDNNLVPGNYVITITDDLGCESIVMFEIFEELIVEEFVSNETCFGACDGVATAFVMGGQENYSITWSNGSTELTQTDLCPGVYDYTVIDNFGTIYVDSILIRPGNILTVSGTYDDVLCDENDVTTILALAEGGDRPYQYQWSTGSQDSSIQVGDGSYMVTITDENNCTLSEEFTVLLADPIVVSGTIMDDDCSVLPTGEINVNISGGLPPYSFLWSTGAISEDINLLFGGNYSITITDTRQCSIDTFFTVQSPTNFDVMATVRNVNCDSNMNGAIDVNVIGGQGPFGFLWNTGDTTQNISMLQGGVYNVTVTDAFNCSQVEQIEVLGNTPLLLVDTIQNVSCFGLSNGQISLHVSGGSSPYEYQWSTGDTSRAIGNLTANQYDVTITDGRLCTSVFQFNVTEPQEIIVDDTITSASCGGGADGAISLTVNGGTAPYQYLWNTGGQDSFIINASSGTFSITITDDENCVYIDSFLIGDGGDIVISPTIISSPCYGESLGEIRLAITGGLPPYDVLWSTGSTETEINNLMDGTYEVTINDEGGCQRIEEFQVLSPDSIIARLETTNPICFGDTGSITAVVFGGTPPYFYQWSSGEQSAEIQAWSNILYSVTITDANMCSRILQQQLSQPDSLVISIVQTVIPTSANNDGSILISVDGGVEPYNITWSDPLMQTTVLADSLATGTYTVTAIDDLGCVAQLEIMLANGELSVDIDTMQNYCLGMCNGRLNVGVSGGTEPYLFQWSTGETSNEIINLCNGTYSVTITDALGTAYLSGEIVISSPPQLVVEELINTQSCPTINDAGIDLSVSGGSPSYQYVWNTGDTTSTLNNLTYGSFAVTVTDVTGCYVVKNYEVSEVTSLNFDVSEGVWDCENQTASIQFTGETPDLIYLNDSLYYLIDQQEVFELNPGSYVVKYELSTNCIITHDTIILAERNTYNIDGDPDSIVVYAGDEVVLAYDISPFDPPGGFNIDWIVDMNFDCFQIDGENRCEAIVFSANNSTNIEVILIDENGCQSSDIIYIKVLPQIKLFLPDIFTPNNDGINDRFSAFTDENIRIESFKIFNRWGSQVFERSTINVKDMKGWDGTVHEEYAAEGVYTYIIEWLQPNGTPIVQYGDVTLVR